MSKQPASADPVALVTGSGSKRVGYHVAAALAERGYRMVLHANTSLAGAEQSAREFTAAGHETIAIRAEINDESQVRQMFEAVQTRFGRLDVLVNCAAIWQCKPLEAVTADDVRQHFEINTLGTFLCCQHAGQIMVAQASGGAIVNFGDWAIVRPYVDYAAYFPSKGAIPALTRSMAVELARRNPRVRVNAILPGPAMLPADLPADERAAAIAGTLLQREGTPQNLVHAVLFLLENDFVTGVCLPVDGGRTVNSPD